MKIKLTSDDIFHLFCCFAASTITSSVIAHTLAPVIACILAGIAAGLALGIGKEFGDAQARDNQWSWRDMGFDALGAVVGSMFGFVRLLL